MRAPTFLVITGTDTGVGKTWVACALAGELRDAGCRVVAVKPIETGCDVETSPDEDGVRLAHATGQLQPRGALERLRAAVAPAEAADRESCALDFACLTDRIRALGEGADFVLVEGAGGLLAPLTWDHTIIDLARALGARSLVVAADRLGTISHTRMALEILGRAGIEVVAVVVDAPPTADVSTGSNAAAIGRYAAGVPIVETARSSPGGDAIASLGPLATRLIALR